MKRESAAERALKDQVRRIQSDCEMLAEEAMKLNIRINTMCTLRDQLKDEIKRLEAIRLNTGKASK
jgi:prefoldin subunit 5